MSRARDLFNRLSQGGEPEVLDFINRGVSEELFLDYKRSADDGNGISLHNRDRANLAKAISGFGNSEGGVIVWGVDCRTDPVLGDVPSAAHRISNTSRFKSWLEQATTGLTVPPHSGIVHHSITEGFVITLIPAGEHAPYQVVGEQSYYIRAGSNFVKAPHAVLAGMFGRRPQPSIKHHYIVNDIPKLRNGAIETEIGILLRNFGKGIAEDIYLNFTMTGNVGERCAIRFELSQEQEVWRGRTAFGRQIQLITRDGFRLPPEADVLPLTLKISLRNPIERDFSFTGTAGCTGAEPWRFSHVTPMADIVEATDQLLRTPANAADIPALSARFTQLFFPDK